MKAARLVAALVLSACACSALQAQPLAQQRDVVTRFGMTPAQARDAYARLGANEALITELSRQTGVQRRTLQAVALELGARNAALPAQAFVSLIRARAGDAANALKTIASLTRTVAALDPGSERSQALAVLKLAQAAFDEGRLEEAEAQFARLSFLRQSQLASARAAWWTATDLQADSAALRGDAESADRILSAKSAAFALQREEDERQQWRTEIKRANVWKESGEKLGRNEDLVRAVRILEESALPLAPRARVADDWAATQLELGNALARLGDFEDSHVRFKQAINSYLAALQERTRDRVPGHWATLKSNLGAVTMTLGERENDPELLDEALVHLREALEVRARKSEPLEWAATQNNLGNALMRAGEYDADPSRLEEALRAYDAA